MNSKQLISPRVRFAPSPTGRLHLGGARTALFNWLFAKHHQGVMLLRIEDTDRLRSKSEYTDQICNSLSWLGLNWDEEIVFQSKRGQRYSSVVDSLLRSNNAYRCFCSKNDINRQRDEANQKGEGYKYDRTCRDLPPNEIDKKIAEGQTYATRLKVPDKTVEYNDHIYGEIKVNTSELDDFIIARTDGTPTYNLVVVVDDHEMEITHVIRGEDHVSNTPKQILIYEAMNFPVPIFAHLPMILGSDKRRMSKRHGATGVHEYRDMGYLPQVLTNYLALLGWNPGTEEEIFDLDRLSTLFSLKQVQKKAAVYDEKKLHWVSGQHVFKLSADDLLHEIRKIFPNWKSDHNDTYNKRVLDLLKLRAKTLVELDDISSYFYTEPNSYDEKAASKRWKNESVNDLMNTLLTELDALPKWNETTIEAALRQVAEQNEISAGKLIHPLRLALSGVSAGPSLFAMMELLNKEPCIHRIKNALNSLPLNKN